MPFHVILCEKFKLLYVPVPKCACTSIKYLMYYMENGESYDRSQFGNQDIHSFYGYAHLVEDLSDFNDWYKFAVVRDPIARFKSFYQNKIVNEKKYINEFVDINQLALNLEKYRTEDRSLKHHTDEQSHFLGSDLDVFDFVCQLENLSTLYANLKNIVNLDFSIPKHQVSRSDKLDLKLSKASLEKLISFYHEDYILLSSLYKIPSLSSV